MLSEAGCDAVSETEIEKFLRELFSRSLNISAEAMGLEESFFSLGLTSLIHQEVINSLTKSFGELSSTVLFEFPNLRLLKQHLWERSSRFTHAG